jgi:hypothetical protein
VRRVFRKCGAGTEIAIVAPPAVSFSELEFRKALVAARSFGLYSWRLVASLRDVISESTLNSICERTIAELRGLAQARNAFGISEKAFNDAVRKLQREELTPIGIVLSRTDRPNMEIVFTLSFGDCVCAVCECPAKAQVPTP